MNDLKRRIIYVWNYREWGGAQIYFMSLMKEAKAVYDVLVMLPSDSEKKVLDYLDALDIPYKFLGPAPAIHASHIRSRVDRRLALITSEARIVSEVLRESAGRETIVHIDLGFWQSFFPLFRLARRVDVFQTIHTALPRLKGPRGLSWTIKGNILSRLSRCHFIASNREARASLRPYLTAEKQDQIDVTYAGYDPDEIDRVSKEHPGKDAILRKYGLSVDVPIIISVGQFIDRKGCSIVLEALRQLKENGRAFVFLWLGTRSPDSDIQKRIDAYGLGNSFRLMSPDDVGDTREDLLRLAGIAELFVIASLQEGLPIALVEAMALGLPCISTRVNAIPEAIEHGHNGILIEPSDPAALATAVSEMLDDPDQRAALGIAAKQTASERFSEKITARQTLELYDAVWKTDERTVRIVD